MDNSRNLGKALRNPVSLPHREPKILIPESAGRDILQERYDYIARVFEQEFEETYYRFFSCSILHYELMNLVSICKSVMEEFGFPYRGENRLLNYAVTAVIADYLEEGGDDAL